MYFNINVAPILFPQVLVWWKCAQDEVYPWSPVVRDCDRANLLVYSLTG